MTLTFAALALVAMAGLPAPTRAQMEPPHLACSDTMTVVSYPTYQAIHVYGFIDTCMAWRFATLADQLVQLSRVRDELSAPPPGELRVLLHSLGGSLADAAAIVGAMERLREAGVAVRVIVDGEAYGVAVLVFAAADRRTMAERAVRTFAGPDLSGEEPAWRRLLGLPGPQSERARWWAAWEAYLAERLGVPLSEVQAMIRDRRMVTGTEAAKRGWLK